LAFRLAKYRDLTYGVGEHIAAGAPVPKIDTEAIRRLVAVMQELERQLRG
jgi:hypothetical protein